MIDRWHDEEWLKSVTLETAVAEIENAVYEASSLLERLEGVGRLLGNGHHARQKVAAFAAKELKERLDQ